MTKNERSLQWVIAGIFFVVCFAFLSMDLPKPFVLQRADEDFFVYHRLFYFVLG